MGKRRKTLAALYEVYFQEIFHKNLAETEPFLIHRPIPVNRSIDVSYPMAVYDNSREIVRNRDLIAVAKGPDPFTLSNVINQWDGA